MKQSIRQINWSEITAFYLIAVLFSAPFRLGLISLEDIISLPNGLNRLYRVFRGIGPFLGYIAVFYLINKNLKHEITILGKNGIISFLSLFPMLIGLTIAGVINDENVNSHFFGFTAGFTLIFYALFEEFGWRGYLQQALKPINLPLRVFIIGTLWYIWHLNFLNPNISIQMHLIHYFSLLVGSWGLLKISELTSSLLFVTSVHMVFNISADINCTLFEKLSIIVVSIIIWTGLIFYLIRKKRNVL